MAQRDAAELLEVCCLWHSTWATLQTYIGAGDALEKIDAMWKQGCPGLKFAKRGENDV